ncbi:hypothetical protein FHS85_001750 [Rhodoligotrophos appendicifer]|uniref:hypothetical protein n=1 Tax=Rhodoligotrophos appendicifer TaxID=987056 RepID=UPI001184BF95|nr:hypothetical protein [Rhodoligotrophos appendicifer]
MDTVEITLADEVLVLRPTLEAAMLVDSRFGGYSAAFQSLLGHSLDAMVGIVAAGSGKSINTALREKVYAKGVRNLVAPLSQYLTLLLNGGRRPEDETAEGK